MPDDGPPYLQQATINVIREWIQNGALPWRAGASRAPPGRDGRDAPGVRCRACTVHPADGIRRVGERRRPERKRGGL